MKKIIVLMAISLLAISCTNGDTTTKIKDENNGGVTNELPKVDENEIPNDEENTNTDETNVEGEEIENKEENNTEEETNEATDENTNDEALEKEVNDLLDEFIDSLDEYEK